MWKPEPAAVRIAAAFAARVSNAIRNCPLCVMKNCPTHGIHDLG